jgi:hypothetical protein
MQNHISQPLGSVQQQIEQIQKAQKRLQSASDNKTDRGATVEPSGLPTYSGPTADDVLEYQKLFELFAACVRDLGGMTPEEFKWFVGTADEPGAIERTFLARREKLMNSEAVLDVALRTDPKLDAAKTLAPPVMPDHGRWVTS